MDSLKWALVEMKRKLGRVSEVLGQNAETIFRCNENLATKRNTTQIDQTIKPIRNGKK
jgi:hypothetical protein